MTTAEQMQQPSVFDFLDFRKYITACYEYKKCRSKAFSYRMLARKIGMNSPDYFTMVLKGRRALVREQAFSLSSVLGLSSREQKYFLALVHWNQAKSGVEKEAAWDGVLRFAPSQSHILNEAEAQIFKSWYLLSLYELVSFSDFSADPDWISRKFRRKITPKDAAHGLAVLSELGLIEPCEHGYRRGKGNLRAGGAPSELIRAYHGKMLDLAKMAIHEVPFGERLLSNCVIAIPKSRYAEFCGFLESCQEEVQKLATQPSQDTVNCLYQVSMQLFPLTDSSTN